MKCGCNPIIFFLVFLLEIGMASVLQKKKKKKIGTQNVDNCVTAKECLVLVMKMKFSPRSPTPNFGKNQSNADINGGLWGKSLSFARISEFRLEHNKIIVSTSVFRPPIPVS